MQLRAEQLHGHLAKSLAPVYAVHGDEPLLALEAADAVRAAARRQGFSERVVFEPGRGFDWSEFTHAAARPRRAELGLVPRPGRSRGDRRCLPGRSAPPAGLDRRAARALAPERLT